MRRLALGLAARGLRELARLLTPGPIGPEEAPAPDEGAGWLHQCPWCGGQLLDPHFHEGLIAWPAELPGAVLVTDLTGREVEA